MTVGSMARVRVPVWRTLLLGGLTAAVGLMGNALAAFLTEWTGSFAWFAAPGVGVLVAAVMALVQAYGKAHVEDQFPDTPAPAPGQPYQPYPPYQPYHPHPGARTTAPTKGTPLLAALAITLVVIGVGGFALAWGARFAIGWITGDEDGVDRLTRVVSVEDKGVVVRVEFHEASGRRDEQPGRVGHALPLRQRIGDRRRWVDPAGRRLQERLARYRPAGVVPGRRDHLQGPSSRWRETRGAEVQSRGRDGVRGA